MKVDSDYGLKYSIKAKKDEFRAKGIYYTPPELGNYLKSFLPEDINEIYDPTCGHGALLKLFGDDVRKYGQEINPEAIETARSLPNSEIVFGDTLKEPAFLGHKFKAIIANPPFSTVWEQNKTDPRFSVAPGVAPKNKSDFAFILHILYYLADGGTAAVIVSPGILYRGNAEGKIRKWMVEQNYVDQVIDIAPKTFVDTDVSVTVLILKKNRTRKEITFLDRASGRTKELTVEQIAEESEDYQLSPGRLNPKPFEPRDPLELPKLDLSIRESTVRSLRLSIQIAETTEGIFPELMSLDEWFKQLKQVIIDAEKRLKERRSKKANKEPLNENLSLF